MMHATHRPLIELIRGNRAVLARLGTAAGILMMLRSARQVLLPLWGLSIGLPDEFTALIVGVGGAIDFALFYTSGWIMDRFGRRASAVPALIGLGLAFLVLAFTHDVPSAASWFAVITGITGLANGIASGIVMTLGADLAGVDNPAPFLGAWRMITDSASASVPFLISGITLAVSISAVSGLFGVLGLAGAWLMARYIPVYVEGETRGSGRAARKRSR